MLAMKIQLASLWFILLVSCALFFSAAVVTREASIEEITAKYGYRLETHTVVTADGYLLTAHRIPYGRKQYRRDRNRPPVLLVHGLMQSSQTYLSRTPNLAFSIADAGYDVWFFNYRGNEFSRRHLRLDPDRDGFKFYNHTLTELGALDLPAVIDYILDLTGYPQLAYVGGSMGGTLFWIMGATKPQYMQKIALMVGIGPVGVMQSENPLLTLVKLMTDSIERLGIAEFRLSKSIRNVGAFICSGSMWLQSAVCDVIIQVLRIADNDLKPYHIRIARQIFRSGASIYIVRHYLQMYKSKRFQMYDYGNRGNIERYNSVVPPEYDLWKINCSMYVICSNPDAFSSVEDMEILSKRFARPPVRILEYVEGLSHVGLFMSQNVHKAIDIPIVQLIKDKYRKVRR